MVLKKKTKKKSKQKNKKTKKNPKYIFDFQVLTDGFAVSLQFIEKNAANKKREIQVKKNIAKIKAFEDYKGLSGLEVQNIKKQKEDAKTAEKEKQALLFQEKIKNMSAAEKAEKAVKVIKKKKKTN